MKPSPVTLLQARLASLYLLSWAAVSGSLIAWQGAKALHPWPLLWPPVALAAAALGGASLQDRLAVLVDKHTRARTRSVIGVVYGAVLLVVSLGLLSGSRDAAQAGGALLRGLQPLFLLLAGFGRGHLGTLVNAFALTSTSMLAGGPGAALSATLHAGILVFFLAADRGARLLTEFPVEELPSQGRMLVKGAMPAAAVALLLGVFFWAVPPAPYAPIAQAGAIASLPADKLVGLLSNLILVAVLSTLAFWLLLRFGSGGRSAGPDAPLVEVVTARRKEGRTEGASFREPPVPANQWRARIVALYVRTAAQLAKGGRRRAPSQTPKEFARLLAPAGASAELAELFGRARYGREEPTEADFDRAARVSRELLDRPRERGNPGPPGGV